MAFADIAKKIKYPDKTTPRFKRLDAYDRLRAGTFYDHITTPFSLEFQSGGQYIPMVERRPSLIWNGAKMLADQISGLMWGDEQMPIVRTYFGNEPNDQDREAEESIQHLVETLNLDAIMDDATEKASSGSAAIVIRATDEKEPYIEVLPGRECVPTFDPKNPFRLLELEQLYPTTGQACRDLGYTIPDEDVSASFWFRILFDKTDETRFLPLRDDKFQRLGQKDPDDNNKIVKWVEDAENSGPHGWPCINVLWVKSPKGNRIDGECLYAPIVDDLVDIDYGLSQCSRGFRYTADPMLMIRRGEIRNNAMPATSIREKDARANMTMRDGAGRFIKSPNNVLDVEIGGDAKMLEISGQGLREMSEFIKLIREWGLEICGGMKADATNTKGVESGRALEILYQALMLVLKRYRVALGNKGFIPLVRLLLTGLAHGVIAVEGVENVDPKTTMRLVWPAWMTPSGSDLASMATALQSLAGGSATAPVAVLPEDTVTRIAATNLGINDVSSQIEELEKQKKEREAKEQQAAQQSHDQALELATAPKPAPAKG